jgi:hypothetical protein
MLNQALDAGRPLADLNQILGGEEFTPPTMDEALAPLREPLSDDPYAYLELSDPFAVRMLDDVAPPVPVADRRPVDLDAILSGDPHPGIDAVRAALPPPLPADALRPRPRPRLPRSLSARLAVVAIAAVLLGAGAAVLGQARHPAAAARPVAGEVEEIAPGGTRPTVATPGLASALIAPRPSAADATALVREAARRVTAPSPRAARPAGAARTPARRASSSATTATSAAPAPAAPTVAAPAPDPAESAPSPSSGLKTPDWALTEQTSG